MSARVIVALPRAGLDGPNVPVRVEPLKLPEPAPDREAPAEPPAEPTREPAETPEEVPA